MPAPIVVALPDEDEEKPEAMPPPKPKEEPKLPAGTEFEIEIQQFVRAKDDSFVLYVICSTGVDPRKKQCSVLRRYRNFDALKAQLESEHNVVLPPLPTKFSFNALFNRFNPEHVQGRQSSLEAWLNNVYGQKNLRSTALIEFLTVEPEYDFVLDFKSHERMEVVVKKSGTVRLYKDGDARTPRTPWIPTESELKRQLDVYNLFEEGKGQETYSVPLSKLSEGHDLTAQK